MARATRRRTQNRPQVPFPCRLALNQWLFGLFDLPTTDGFTDFGGRRIPVLHAFKEKFQVNENTAEGLDENNVHRFHHALINQTVPLDELARDVLLEYDQNIVSHTQRLNERRITRGQEPIVWKYFQYLTLLFTEIYLDRYFRQPETLLADLNSQVERFNEDKNEADKLEPLNGGHEPRSQLNKLAYWMATGSGKTLIMHVNILQYQYYLEKYGNRRDLNRIILLTPNEGLSFQHLGEFEAAGIQAELFDKDGPGLFAGRAVEIIDVHKLREEMGAKTIAVEAFEGNNLVLIDEGHRGASSGETGTWMRFRNALCETGFSFEYSATFGQAVKGDRGLANLYAKCILFDYSYKYFYGDGFGKDYNILNLDETTQAQHLELYLTACLLAFFQQQRLFREHPERFRLFNLERPLWVFVGGRVTKSLSSRDASDIIEILLFLARFVTDRAGSIERIRRVLTQGLVAADGRNLFAGRFPHLNTSGMSPEWVFDEVLEVLFNAPGGGALHIENLKGATGEIALRLGDNEPFGVINVGDDAKLCSLCDAADAQGRRKYPDFVVGDRDFTGSLFQDINKADSTVNVLIGSKKFTEGWNSWRVSTMGLMNIGSTEGAQIIQLFGRGVRLRGYARSLKRSNRVTLPEDVERPQHIGLQETLNVFGIRADYMAQFRQYLEEEGLPPNENQIEFFLPIIKNLGTQRLKTIRLKRVINGVSTEFGDAFKKLGPVPTLVRPNPDAEPATRYLQDNQVVLNWYPKIQAMRDPGRAGTDEEATLNQAHLTAKHVAFLDLDRLFFDLQQFKAERSWHNLNLSRDAIRQLLSEQSWYTLLIPQEELSFQSYERVRVWQEIAAALLRKYCERYYTFRKREWELPHLEYQELEADDPNFPSVSDDCPDGAYRILIDESEQEIVERLTELKGLIERGELRPWEFRGLKAMWFGRHLYEPLLHLTERVVEVRPVALNRGEQQFVEDLKQFHDGNTDYFNGRELYLLRNLSKGRGVGFFEAGNFHPDFILWLIVNERQYITFIDPKGIRHLGPTDPKIRFHETVKEIERRLADPSVCLSAFIVSNTPSHTMRLLWGMNKEAMEACNILFQEEDRDSYIQRMLDGALVADRI
jgi:hypothetical protein